MSSSSSSSKNKDEKSVVEPEEIDNVLVVIAMEAEAMPFITKLSLERQVDFFPSPTTPFHAFAGTYSSTTVGSNSQCKVTVVTNGKDDVHETGVDNVGTVPAALVTWLALERLPDTQLVVNAGTCGGFQRRGAAVGDVYLTDAVAHHDRRIPIADFDTYGIGKLETVVASQLATTCHYKMGLCTTGNSLDYTPQDDVHMERNNASIKDMEAAAVAWSTHLYGKPYLGVKVVTDIVDGGRPSQDEFLENLETAALKLQHALPNVIQHVCGKRHDEL